MNVGIVGCGVISRHYASHAGAFGSFDLVACADVAEAQAAELAAAHELRALTPSALIADPDVDVVLNLTPPAVHAAVCSEALRAGKHVYTEKPLATDVGAAEELVAEAEARGLRLGCAPDIFLGGAYQAARAQIDAGAIGEPLSVAAAMLGGGQERWHPNPDIFFADGAGPLLDLGPYYLSAIVALLGPIGRVAGFASTRVSERRIEIGPRAGERFGTSTPTHTSAVMELRSGVTATLVASFEAPGLNVCDFEIHGSEGVLGLPDPNSFGGPLRRRSGRRGGEWEELPYASRGGCDTRGIGLDDMLRAMAADRPHRASGRLGLHVLEVARGVLQSAGDARAVEIGSELDQPAPLPVAEAA